MTALTPVTTSTAAKSDTFHTPISPDVYIVTNLMQRQHNLRVLDLLQYSFIDETEKQQFLDLGCGTGDFTRDHLLPRCQNVERMVAVDMSEDMVDYAKKHFAHPKICHDVLDIMGNGVTEFVKRYGRFDRVYSFFCLNWTRDQETSFKNVAELMKPGGECLLLLTASNSFAYMRRQLATMEYWQKYRKMLENTIPRTTDLPDRLSLLSYTSGLLKNAGLISTTCEVLQVTHTYSSVEELTQAHMSYSCLSTVVTEEEKPLLLKDVAQYAARLWAEKEAGGFSLHASMLLVRAHKPRP